MRRTFPRQVQALEEIFALAARFCASANVDASTRWLVDLTLEELFTNVLKHNPAGKGDVLIELDRQDDAVRIALTDFDADPFDPTKIETPDIDAPLEQRRPGGLGIHLVKQMADDMHYEYRDRVSKTIVTKRTG
jgi:anti-sigma regulatory factor (Ser/Thr protein kinase)